MVDDNDEINSNSNANAEDLIATVTNLIELNKIKSISMRDLKISERIGQGGQAQVYEGYYGEIHVAIKVLNKIDWKCLAHEIVIIANLQHPCIPTFYGVVNEDNILAFVFDFIKGKTLDGLNINKMSFNNKLKIIKTLSSVLEYIHTNNFIHRDLKPENVMIDRSNYNTYLIDFGISKVCTNPTFTITRTKGTLNYLAPECLDIKELNENGEIVSLITPKVDVWSFGCIVSWLFSGVAPWTNKFRKSDPLIQRALIDKVPFPIPDKSAENETLKKIIEMSTVVDYKLRADMRQVNEILNLLC